jgi:hypothetical protein
MEHAEFKIIANFQFYRKSRNIKSRPHNEEVMKKAVRIIEGPINGKIVKLTLIDRERAEASLARAGHRQIRRVRDDLTKIRSLTHPDLNGPKEMDGS